MKKIIMISTLLILLVGCNNSKTHKQNESKDTSITEEYVDLRVEYPGNAKGCIAVYDPFYCADKYRPANYKEFTLHSNKPVAYVRYMNKTYTLDTNQTEELLKILK